MNHNNIEGFGILQGAAHHVGGLNAPGTLSDARTAVFLQFSIGRDASLLALGGSTKGQLAPVIAFRLSCSWTTIAA